MSEFNIKPLSTIESLGEKLKKHRLEKGLTIKQAADRLQINSKYLNYIEDNEFNLLPPEIYAKKLLRRYAELLDLNPEIASLYFEQEKSLNQKLQTKPEPAKTVQSVLTKFFYFLIKPTTIRYFIFSLIILVVLIYIGYGINKIFAPPELIIKNPFDNSIITEQRTIRLEGITEKEVDLTINGKPVLCDQNGGFSLTLDLQSDLNIIKISAKKKYSRPNTIYRQIIVIEKN